MTILIRPTPLLAPPVRLRSARRMRLSSRIGYARRLLSIRLELTGPRIPARSHSILRPSRRRKRPPERFLLRTAGFHHILILDERLRPGGRSERAIERREIEGGGGLS